MIGGIGGGCILLGQVLLDWKRLGTMPVMGMTCHHHLGTMNVDGTATRVKRSLQSCGVSVS